MKKQIAKKFHTAVSEYDIKTIEELAREDYIQHNPNLATGLAAFTNVIPALEENQTKIQNYRMLEDGSYIIMHHKWVNAEPFGARELSAFHIIRFDERNKIAEHWNVMSENMDIDGDTEIIDIEKTKENKSFIESLETKKKIHAIFGEGNFVICISEGKHMGENTACYNLYQIKEGQIHNQWSIYQTIPTEGAMNENGMFGFR